LIQAIAIDDETPALELLRYYCGKVDFLSLERTFHAPAEALKYIKKYPVDVIFLDIQMPGILGTEFCKRIERDIMVVFTTAFGDYAIEGFNLNVIDFLLKPYPFERFEQATEKVRQHYLHHHQHSLPVHPYIFLRSDYSLVKIPLDDLLYIEGFEDYSKLYFGQEPPMVIRITLKALLEKLPPEQFLRIHRSYIVRIDKAEKIRSNTLFILDKELHIGRVYKANVMEVLQNAAAKKF
jgi:DNA-binding LytR/AlgR family response regulator